MILTASILVFALIASGLSLLIGRSKDLDRGKIAFYVILIAWGALFYGFSLAKISH